MADIEIKLNTPLTAEKTVGLCAGSRVLLSGVIYTARDRAHMLIAELIKENKPLPFPLRGAVVYYCGAALAKPGEIIGSCGPTSSARMDSYTPLFTERGVRGMIGKGNRAPEAIEAIKKYGAVYFAAIGGAAVFYKQFVESAELIAYPELFAEAVYKLTVKDFPLITAIDAAGNSIFANND